MGLTVSECSEGTSVRWCSWSTAFVSPATPPAASAWPMLDFTDPIAQKPSSSVCPAERPYQALEFDGVAECGARGVCLDAADRARVDPGAVEGLGDNCRLGEGTWHGEAAAAADVAHGGGPDDGVDAVAVALRPVERLEDDGADALRGDVSVAALAEGPATPFAGVHVDRAVALVLGRVQRQVHPADERHLALAARQALDGQVHRGERGGAEGVHRHARPVEVAEEGDPVGDLPLVEGDGQWPACPRAAPRRPAGRSPCA